MRSCKAPGWLDDRTRANTLHRPRPRPRSHLRPSPARGVPLRPTLFLLGASMLVMLGVAGLADAEPWSARATDFIHPLGGPLNQGSLPCVGAFPGPGGPGASHVAKKWEYNMTPPDPDEVGYQPLAPYVADIDADGVPEVVFAANYAEIYTDNLLESTIDSKLVILNGTTGRLDVDPWQAGGGKIMFSSPAIGELEHANPQKRAELALFVGDFLGLFKTGSSMKFFQDPYSSPAKSYALDSPLGDADNATKSEVVTLPPFITESNDDAGNELVFPLILADIELGPTFNTQFASIVHRVYGLQWRSHADNPRVGWQRDATNMTVSLPAVADIDADGNVEVTYGIGFPPTPDTQTNGTVSDASAKGRDVVAFQPANGAQDWAWRSPGIPATIPVLLGPDGQGEYTSVVTWIEDRDDNYEPWRSTNVTLLRAQDPPAQSPTAEIDGLLGVPPLVVQTTDNDTPPNPVDLLLFIVDSEETRMGPSSAVPSTRIVALDAHTLNERWNLAPPGADVHAGFPRALVADLDNDHRPNLAILENGTDDGQNRFSHLVVYDVFEDGLEELWRVPIDLDMPTGLAIADVDGDDGRCEIVASAGVGKPSEGSFDTGGMGHGVVKVFEPVLPDLKITDLWLDREPVLGQPVKAWFKVRNQGTPCAATGPCPTVSSFETRLTTTAGEEASTTINFDSPLRPGAPDKTAYVLWTPTVPSDATRSLTLRLDPDHQMDELAEDNNERKVHGVYVHGEDLVILAASSTANDPAQGPDPVLGQPATVNIQIENVGESKAQAGFTVAFFDGPETQPARGTANVPASLAKDAPQTIPIAWTPDRFGSIPVSALVDSGRTVIETDEANNRWPADGQAAFTVRAADLTLKPDDIRILQSGTTAGSTVTVRVTIHNEGDHREQNALVSFRFDGATTDDCATTITVDAWSSIATPDCVWELPDDGRHTVHVRADPQDAVAERIEDNNVADQYINADLPELLVDAIEVSPNPPILGEPATVTVNVRNEGAISADSAFLLQLEHAPDLDLSQTVPSGLSPGSSYEATFPWTPAIPGPQTLRATVDPTDIVNEVDDDNNVRDREVSVAAPDLRIERADLSTTSTCPDDMAASAICVDVEVDAAFRVRNVGDAPAKGSFLVHFSENGAVFGEQVVTPQDGLGPGKPGLPPQAVTAVLHQAWLPHVPGYRSLNATADAGQAITEADEANEMAAKLLVRAPDFAILEGDIRVEPAPRLGQPSAVSVYVRNVGPVAGRPTVHLGVLNQDTGAVVDLPLGIGSLTFDHNDVVELTQVWTPTEEGAHRITATVDPLGQFKEYSEANNTASMDVFIHSFEGTPAGQPPAGWTEVSQVNPVGPTLVKDWKVVGEAGTHAYAATHGLASRVYRSLPYDDYAITARMRMVHPVDTDAVTVPLPLLVPPTTVPPACAPPLEGAPRTCTPAQTTPPVGGDQTVPPATLRASASLLYADADQSRAYRLEFDTLNGPQGTSGPLEPNPGRISLHLPGGATRSAAVALRPEAPYDVTVTVEGTHVSALINGPGADHLLLEGDYAKAPRNPGKIGFDTYPADLQVTVTERVGEPQTVELPERIENGPVTVLTHTTAPQCPAQAALPDPTGADPSPWILQQGIRAGGQEVLCVKVGIAPPRLFVSTPASRVHVDPGQTSVDVRLTASRDVTRCSDAALAGHDGGSMTNLSGWHSVGDGKREVACIVYSTEPLRVHVTTNLLPTGLGALLSVDDLAIPPVIPAKPLGYQDNPPKAVILWTPGSMNVPFDAGQSEDLDGDELLYEWDFGDVGPGNHSAQEKLVHGYAAAGEYTVRLTVREATGRPPAPFHSETATVPATCRMSLDALQDFEPGTAGQSCWYAQDQGGSGTYATTWTLRDKNVNTNCQAQNGYRAMALSGCTTMGNGYGQNENDWFTSPFIDLADAAAPKLRYRSWSALEAGDACGWGNEDFLAVDVRADPSDAWHQIDYFCDDHGWQESIKSLSPHADADDHLVQLRFRFGSQGDPLQDDGVFIDDIRVEAS